MHEQATLACPFPAAGKTTGDCVSISEVRTHYSTSSAANAALRFVCFDCGVPVGARIIQPYVPGRKITPSSGFRASDGGKPHTCDREPKRTASQAPASGHAEAHSTQGGAPERWIDPHQPQTQRGAPLSARSPISEPKGGSSRGRGGSERGHSVGQSQTIEKFAREWRQMGVNQRHAKSLMAPWNRQNQGSYYSAFHPLKYFPKVVPGAMLIYEGTARHITSYADGYDVELNEHALSEPDLHLWIPRKCLSLGPAGITLASQLADLSLTPSSGSSIYVYALGTFIKRPIGTHAGLVLEITHPHMCWIDAAALAAQPNRPF